MLGIVGVQFPIIPDWPGPKTPSQQLKLQKGKKISLLTRVAERLLGSQTPAGPLAPSWYPQQNPASTHGGFCAGAAGTHGAAEGRPVLPAQVTPPGTPYTPHLAAGHRSLQGGKPNSGTCAGYHRRSSGKCLLAGDIPKPISLSCLLGIPGAGQRSHLPAFLFAATNRQFLLTKEKN